MSDVLFDFNICAFACQVVVCQKKDDIHIERGQTSFYERKGQPKIKLSKNKEKT